MLQRGHSGDRCDLASTLCEYDLRSGDLYALSCAGSEAGKYLFRAHNMWWRCAQYLLLLLVARCLETIDVCIWCMFIFVFVCLL